MKRRTLAALAVLLLITVVVLAGLTWTLATLSQEFLVAFAVFTAILFIWSWAREWYVDRKRAALGLGPRYHGIPQARRPERPR